jgi:hypothetical protein
MIAKGILQCENFESNFAKYSSNIRNLGMNLIIYVTVMSSWWWVVELEAVLLLPNFLPSLELVKLQSSNLLM